MKQKELNRSEGFILFHQLQGLCSALQIIVENEGQITSPTYALLSNIRKRFLELANGGPFENFPMHDDESTPADLLAIAKVLLHSSHAFMTESEKKSVAENAATWLGLASQARSLITG